MNKFATGLAAGLGGAAFLGGCGALALLKNQPCYLPFEEGQHPVGVTYHRITKGIRFKLYYPCQVPNNPQRPGWSLNPKEASKGLAEFSGIPYFVWYLIGNGKGTNPCAENASVLQSLHQYPLIIFSPGLGGTWDMYSQIAIYFASYGNVVAMIEHADGSSAHWITPEGNHMTYQPPQKINPTTGKFEPYKLKTRSDYIEFRGPQLETRKSEFKSVFNYLLSFKKDAQNDNENDNANNNNNNNENNASHLMDDSLNNNNNNNNNSIDFLTQIAQSIDYNSIIAMGHSFGGATATMSAQELQNKNIKAVVVFDSWFMQQTNERLQQNWEIPYLGFICDGFYRDGNLRTNVKVLNANKSNKKELYYMPGSKHTDFSDVPILLPEFVSKLMNSFGMKPSLLFPNVVKKTLQFIDNVRYPTPSQFFTYNDDIFIQIDPSNYNDNNNNNNSNNNQNLSKI